MTAPGDQGGAPGLERIVATIRHHLELGTAVAVNVTEIDEFTNINYVYRAELPDRSLYVKVVPERPKRLPASLPRERVRSEAEAMRRFRSLAGDAIVVPEVLFVDDREMAFAMTDVGRGRQVLFPVLADRYALLTEQAERLGQALGQVHGGTRGSGPLRPAAERAIVRKVIFDGLMAPGAREVFPELWDEVGSEMQAHDECLVHADLWSKNLLARTGAPLAVVDFEGAFYGDPAFDLGTLAAVALVPALERRALLPAALDFTARLCRSWAAACGDEKWPVEVLPRTFRATATFLAARGRGPFAYAMADEARSQIARLARSLAAAPPAEFASFRSRVLEHAETS